MGARRYARTLNPPNFTFFKNFAELNPLPFPHLQIMPNQFVRTKGARHAITGGHPCAITFPTPSSQSQNFPTPSSPTPRSANSTPHHLLTPHHPTGSPASSPHRAASRGHLTAGRRHLEAARGRDEVTASPKNRVLIRKNHVSRPPQIFPIPFSRQTPFFPPHSTHLTNPSIASYSANPNRSYNSAVARFRSSARCQNSR
jgi:hypothetical protein